MSNEEELNRTFSESSYYDAYKAVRNKIRKYAPDALIDSCFEYLHAPAPNPLVYVKRQPWLVLLLVKWTLLDDESLVVGRPKPSQQQVNALLDQVFALAEWVRLPTEFDDLSLFLRATAYQQFIYQRRASPILVGRQMLYFAGLPDDHYIAQTFESLTGIKLRPFLMLSQALILAFGEPTHRRLIDASFFSTLAAGFALDDVERFLALFASSRPAMRDYLRALDMSIREKKEQPRNASEYFEQSPFLEWPLMRRHKAYECVDVHLLDACVGRFVYSRLREHNKGTFMSHFGPLFEAYVRKAIVHMDLPFLEEKELAKQVPTKNKPSLIDFVVDDGGSRIFIDAKAVEMHYRGKVTHSMAELAIGLDSSLLKAISQAHSTMRVLTELGPAHDRSVVGPDFLVVVTQSELYVSNGVALASAIGQKMLDELMSNDGGSHVIALDRMYFLTIHEFERLAAAINGKQLGFAEAMARARDADLDPTTRKMVFEQHLNEWGIRKTAPDYLIAETTSTLSSLAQIIRGGAD